MPSARTYIDPHLYLYSDPEWIAETFIDDFTGLINVIDSIKEFEGNFPQVVPAVGFRMSDAVLQRLYSQNPYRNLPAKPFYFKQFINTIMPEILRRSEICPTEHCTPLPVPMAVALPVDPSDGRDNDFAEHVNICVSCSNRLPMTMLYGSGSVSLSNPESVFDGLVSINEFSIHRLICAVNVFPWQPINGRDDLLNVAVKSFAAAESMTDSAWAGNCSKFIGLETFWRSIDRADFRHLTDVYRARIVRSLTQIALGISIDIHAHGMASQSFTYINRQVGKWNAYVFQSGADDQDRRCSRIYYGHVQGGVVLYEYDPDAH